MAALVTTPIVSRVSEILQDTENFRWTLPELLSYITDAAREVCIYKPEACAKTATVTLVAGTKQSLPADGSVLLDVVRNMGVGGATPGRVPRLVSRDLLDAQNPNWHASTPAAEAKHYTFDPQSQKVFYVYPPQPVTPGSLELVYAAAPVELTGGGTLPLDDTWLPAIVNYVLYRCYAKDAEYAGNSTLAVTYYQAFNAMLAGKTGSESLSDPARNSRSMNPLNRNAQG